MPPGDSANLVITGFMATGKTAVGEEVAQDAGGPYVLPAIATVNDGSYPISRPLYMATNGKPNNDIAAFLGWIVSPEGQAIVEREGFFTIGAGKYKAENDKNFK